MLCANCPDFVALDFTDATIYVVEVTAAADTKNLMKRVDERRSSWIDPLREHFGRLSDGFASWDYHVTLFVRDEEVTGIQRAVVDFPDVSVISLKATVFSWNWDWQRETSLPTNALRESAKRARVYSA